MEELFRDPGLVTLLGVVGVLSSVLIVLIFALRKKSNVQTSKPMEEPAADLNPSERNLQRKTTPSESPSDSPLAPTSADPSLSQTLVDGKTSASGFKTVSNLESALSGTKKGLLSKLRGIFSSKERLNSTEIEHLEEILYTSDLGPKTVQRLMGAVESKLSESNDNGDFDSVRVALRDEMELILSKEVGESLWCGPKAGELKVWMIVGVNGAGKTTTIGKLAHRMAALGHKVLIAAGDTFRAAAGEQLKVWSDRAKVEIFSPPGVTSPSAVAFDGCKLAQAGDYTLLIVDTAGRLHTQKHLMEELAKMKRVIEKAIPGAPHEILLVLDANSGQNALIQAKEFDSVLNLTGAVLTKMDGTAKGGVAVGVACEVGIPVRLIGVGEGIEDLQVFDSKSFVDSII